MNQADQIKVPQRQGYGAKEIAARLSIDRKTTARYKQREEFGTTSADCRGVHREGGSRRPDTPRARAARVLSVTGGGARNPWTMADLRASLAGTGPWVGRGNEM